MRLAPAVLLNNGSSIQDVCEKVDILILNFSNKKIFKY